MLALSACTSQPKPQKDSTLPILDISKEYPEIELDIHEIADVEYVPLETTDSSVIGMGLKKKYIGEIHYNIRSVWSCLHF